jgi:hypothetical protein
LIRAVPAARTRGTKLEQNNTKMIVAELNRDTNDSTIPIEPLNRTDATKISPPDQDRTAHY